MPGKFGLNQMRRSMRGAEGAMTESIDSMSREEKALFDRKYERMESAVNFDKIKTSDFLENPPGEEDFNLYFADGVRKFASVETRVRSDMAHENRMKEKFESSSEIRPAAALEYIFGIGVKRGNWLGVSADSRATTDYDDFMNGVDNVITVEDEDEDVAPFGIDVTVATDPGVVGNKLAKGMSQLIYFENKDEKRSIPMLPRYVVSIGGDFVESIVRDKVKIDEAGNIEMVENEKGMLLIRHRILSELHAQAGMRMNQLPPAEKQTDEQADAFDMFASHEQIFEGALTETEKAIRATTTSFTGVKLEEVRKKTIEWSKEADSAYKVLMETVEAMNRRTLAPGAGEDAIKAVGPEVIDRAKGVA